MGFADYLRTRGMDDSEKLYLFAKDGISIMNMHYKKLSKIGELEVLTFIFNSIVIFKNYEKKHPDNFEDVIMKLRSLIINQIVKSLSINNDEASICFNSRERFHLKEIACLQQDPSKLPVEIYSSFYTRPFLSYKAESNNDLGELLLFNNSLKHMIKTVHDSINSI